ncbi:hypothetical protein GJ744_011705 [Endocarpon pusillum]|uniref:Uncharacterized protein n=1 Tax=Endocarpon pusillum TaxID=364733 RepID=A0A8H7E2L8_9EURO|nr:hypothetical protein GJ744_011705 [Endocarpon pusillum]
MDSVINATYEALIISDGMARLAASAVGMGGRYATGHWQTALATVPPYAFGTAWEIHCQTAETVGAKMTEFAFVSVATIVSKKFQVQIDADGAVWYPYMIKKYLYDIG